MSARIVVFGEVLFDHFPDASRVLGGAPFNVAWHLQAFGRQPLFVSRVGCDQEGDQIRRAMGNWGLDTSAVQSDALHPTGRVAVSLDGGEPRYEILPEQAYDYIAEEGLPAADCRLLYHGTLALRTPESRRSLDLLKSRVSGQVFVDVNLRAPWWSADEVRQWLAGADWVKLNHEELDRLHPGDGGLESRMREFLDHYRLRGLLVTLGENGAAALTANGEQVSVEPERQTPVVDCVGAGDAFAAVMLLGILEDWPLAESMTRAQAFASALVGRRGATVDDPAFYRCFVDAWRG